LGGGPEDYPAQSWFLLFDENSDELFVQSFNKIMVYSLRGEFRRVIPFSSLIRTGTNTNRLNVRTRPVIMNFDSKTLLLYDAYNNHRFTFISKEDGSEVDILDIPADEDISTFIMHQEVNNINAIVSMNILQAPTNRLVRYNDGYLLTDFSIDTVYFLSREKKLSPVLVRKPAIQSMDPVIYLNSFVEAGNYQFVLAVTVKNENGKLPRTYLMRDKKTSSIYRQKIAFNDYKGKEVTLSPETIANTQDSRLGLIVLSLTELQEANSENKLSGKLKELVDNSDDDGNDIYMLLHFK
jgi:hypothetical protein